MNDKDFMRQQQAAVERMREMNARAGRNFSKTQNTAPAKPITKAAEHSQRHSSAVNNTPPPENGLNSDKQVKRADGLNIPFLNMLSSDGDTALIIGLILILMSEKTDKILLFALVYILM